jgi:hypothetical protein
MNLKRERYQQGSLTIERRRNGPDVWVYRWRQSGRRRKQILGSAKELSKTQAQKKAATYIEQLKPVREPEVNLTVSQLVDHYLEHEFGGNCDKAAKVAKAYRYILKNYVVPQWGAYALGAVKAVAVESWLSRLTRQTERKQRYVKSSVRHFATPCVTSCICRIPSPMSDKSGSGQQTRPFLSLPRLRRYFTNWKASSLYGQHFLSRQ